MTTESEPFAKKLDRAWMEMGFERPKEHCGHCLQEHSVTKFPFDEEWPCPYDGSVAAYNYRRREKDNG